jgi:hypothetical protein
MQIKQGEVNMARKFVMSEHKFCSLPSPQSAVKKTSWCVRTQTNATDVILVRGRNWVSSIDIEADWKVNHGSELPI